MSNACIVACRPFWGLRSSSLALSARSIASAVAAARPASPRAVPSHISRLGTTPLKCSSLRPPLLRLLDHRHFTTSTVAFARKQPASKKADLHPSSKGLKEAQDAEGNEDTQLPGGDLQKDQITQIFGPGISAAEGNSFLRVLQHRRVTGSLAEKGVEGPTSFPRERALNALEYLRSTYPFDEEAAAAEWARREAQRLEGMMIQRAQDLKLYKKGDSEQTLGNVYGHSELEALRRRNEKVYERQKEEEERRKEVQEKEGLAGKGGTLGPVKAKTELRKKEKSEWLKYYEEQAVIRKEKEAPKMSAAARILPSAFVSALILAGLYIFTETYTPPSSAARLWPDTPPALATCFALLNINLFIFLAWRFPPFYRPFNKYLLQTPGYPTALSVLGNIFSHQDPKHLFMNMLILMGAGPQLHELVGRADFLAVYLAGGVLGSLGSLVASVARRSFAVSTLGASGALAATIGALLLLKDADAFAVPFFPEYRVPVSSAGLLAACLAYEVWGLARGGARTGMDHVAHLGGYATGMAGAGLLKWRVAERRRVAEEKKREMGFLQRTFGAGRDE
ncbi:rhomboid family protein [Diplodia corticola]|uniref:Rhomboid family protein n=1 Tax=Diplodia corticola TaxID=236234 RepID=A0A1J9SFL2_9PEZI|nr:rhomboid family protein [Diplodia corticola]OJD38604.1 rhomboid family protein [Diplodia corticola]